MTNPRSRLWKSGRVIAPLLVAGLAALLAHLDGLWRIDLMLYDAACRAFFKPAPADVVVVGIDETSLAALGRWPWPRRIHAELVEKLNGAGVATIAYDVAFAEPGAPEDDARLAAALRASGVAVLPVVPEQSGNGALVETLPIPALAAAATLGHVDVELDPDGLARSVYLQAGLGAPRWPAFARAVLDVAARRARPASGSAPLEPGAGYLWIRDERVLVAFNGPPGRFRQLSFSDVLERPLPADWPAHAVVLVGLTAAGLGDTLPTPVAGNARPMSGVEFIANVFQGLRTGWTFSYLSTPATVATTAALVLLAALALTVLPRPLWGALIATAITLGLSLVLLQAFRVWFTPAAALAGIGLSYPLETWRRHRRDRAFLRRERALNRTALASMAEAVLTTDRDGRIEYANTVAESWLGRSARDLVGKSLETALDLRTRDGRLPVRSSATRELVEGVLVARGRSREVRASLTPIGVQGEGQGLVVVLADLGGPSDSLRASTGGLDPLTGLPNRILTRQRIDDTLRIARGQGRAAGVLVVDIDRFRLVNRGLGAAVGDALLKAFAARLLSCGALLVGRLGPDQFALVVRATSREALERFGFGLLEAMDPPFAIDGTELRVQASVGASLFPADGEGAEALIESAEAAVSWIQARGGPRVQLFLAQMRVSALNRLVLERALQEAITKGRLELVYQPQLDLATDRVVGVEALARWRHPVHGVVPPSVFIPLAEDTGLIAPLGEWILRAACRQATTWKAEGLPPLRMSVNVSPRQIQPSLVAGVAASLQQEGLEPDGLTLELTESARLDDVEATAAVFKEIQKTGVTLALDDFGVGYSSLEHLRRLPVDIVKIDKSFVEDVTADPGCRSICLAVLAMAQSLGRRVVAEGVETVAQAEFFKARGCDEIQGYLVSPPVAASEVPALVTKTTHLGAG